MRWPDDYDAPDSVPFGWSGAFWSAIERTDPSRVAALKLSDPPDVPATRGELDEILSHRQASDFQARVPEIEQEAKAAPVSLFTPLGADRNGPNQKTATVLAKVARWAIPYIMHFKGKWLRPRPHHLDPNIELVVHVPGHPAYPSGHSTQAHLIALVGLEICQDRTIGDVLWAAADRVAQNREYAGVHYRSDSACGVELAKQLLPFFIEDHRHEIETARSLEWPKP